MIYLQMCRLITGVQKQVHGECWCQTNFNLASPNPKTDTQPCPKVLLCKFFRCTLSSTQTRQTSLSSPLTLQIIGTKVHWQEVNLYPVTWLPWSTTLTRADASWSPTALESTALASPTIVPYSGLHCSWDRIAIVPYQRLKTLKHGKG